MSDDTTMNRRVDEWFAAPIMGHGLYARYQDARDLIEALRHEVDRLSTVLGEARDRLDSLRYAPPEAFGFWLNELAEALNEGRER